MWSAIFGTAILVAILIGAGLVVYDAIYGCKHEYTKTIGEGDITRKKSEYSNEHIKVGKYYVRECSKCGHLKRFNCD